MMGAKNYYNAAHFAECFQRFDGFRGSEQICDIRLMASNEEIYAHKMVLASASEYFKNAIYGLLLNDSGKNELELTDIKYETLSVLVDYMYSGKIEINSDNVFEIYNAADYYLMSFLKEMCLDFLAENFDANNCIKVWLIASSCKNERLITAATNFIFSNLEMVSKSQGFLNLSNEEVCNIFNLWPKYKLFDSIIDSILRWAAERDTLNCMETVLKLFKDTPPTSISDDYLENGLLKNELIQKSFDCNKWIVSIYKEKLKSYKYKPEIEISAESERKFIKFLSDQPIVFMNHYNDVSTYFFKYNCRDGEINLYHEIKDTRDRCSDCVIYKNWMYVLTEKNCNRFTYDDVHKNEFVFQHDHGCFMCSTVLNDSIYIFGGKSSSINGTSIDHNTKQATRYRLLYDRLNAGVAVSDRVIYICGGRGTDIVERFDPREGRSTHFGDMAFKDKRYYYSSAALSNQLYCTNGMQYKMTDVRNGGVWMDIESPNYESSLMFPCLTAAYGQLYDIANNTLYKHNNASQKWENINKFPRKCWLTKAASFE